MTARIAVAFIAAIALLHAQDNAQARSEARQTATDNALRLGVEAYKAGRFAEAAKFFQRVVDMNPQALDPRLYWGIACVAQYVPGSSSPKNAQLAEDAEAQFRRVLSVDDQNETAISWLANLKFMQAQVAPEGKDKEMALDEVEKLYRRAMEINPDNPETHFTLGMIAWTKWSSHGTEARAKSGMKPEEPGPLKDPRIRREMEVQYRRVIDDGISELEIALAMTPEREDAMTYLNLLLRARADLAPTEAVYQADIKESDAWGQKAFELKKRKTTPRHP